MLGPRSPADMFWPWTDIASACRLARPLRASIVGGHVVSRWCQQFCPLMARVLPDVDVRCSRGGGERASTSEDAPPANRDARRKGPAPASATRATLHDVLGESRKSTISFGGVSYSVPHTLVDETIWVRVDGDHIGVCHRPASGVTEVARHLRSTPGSPVIDDVHDPPRLTGRWPGARSRRVRPRLSF